MDLINDTTYCAVLRFYARQSHLIDGGEAEGWADTFADDGVFDSPSYERAVRGRVELVEFARAFARQDAEAGTRTRHVVTTIDPQPGQDADHLSVRAYLQIVTTPVGEQSRLLRHTVIDDDLLHTDEGLRVATRRVTRDDQPAKD